MSFPAYANYTRYGGSCIALLPEHWALAPLKRMVDDQRPITYGIVQAGPDTPDGIPYIRPTDMSDEGGVVDLTRLLRTTEKIANAYKRSSVRAGDLICSIGPSFGKVMVVPPELDGANLTQGTARVAANAETDPRFLFWAIRSGESFAQWEGAVGGATFRALNLEPLARTLIPCPPKHEQSAIATFLDRETAKIDALIEEQQRLIALLNEKRQAVISRAVMAGLNPDAPMKDSGIEWLGEVPAHWEVKRLKYLGAAITGLTYAPDDLCGPEGTLVLRSSNIQSGKPSFEDNVFVDATIPEILRVCAGDILLCSRNGSRALIGKNIILGDEHAGMTWGAFMTVFRSRHASYLYWVFNSSLFAFQSASFLTSTVNQLTIGNLNSMEVPVPPPDEMAKIHEHLSTATGELGELLDASVHAVTLLKERRAALVSDAVTGKIDVRGLAEDKAQAT